MRPWMMALASGVAAIAAAAGLAWIELPASPAAAPAYLAARAPALAIAAIGVYAFAAMLLSTAALIGASLATRRRLAAPILQRTASEADWAAAFGTTGFRRLAVPLAAVSPGRPAIALTRAFDLQAARREVGRLHYLWLARTHFFSALVVLAGIVVLGLVQAQRPMPLLPSPIPTIAAFVVLAAGILFAALGRLALDIAAEPLFDMMLRFPVDRPEIGLLRRAVDLLEYGRATIPAPVEGGLLPGRQLAERLVEAIEGGQRAMLEALGDLSQRTAAAGPANEDGLRALIEAIDDLSQHAGAVGATIEQGQRALLEALGDLSHRTGGVGPAIEAGQQVLLAAVGDLSQYAGGVGPAIEASQRALLDAIGDLSHHTAAVGTAIEHGQRALLDTIVGLSQQTGDAGPATEAGQRALLQAVADLSQHGGGTGPAIAAGQHALLEAIDDLAQQMSAAGPAIEEGQRALLEAIGDLSERTGAAAPAIEAAVAALDNSIRTIAAPVPLGTAGDGSGLRELRSAVETLTGVLARFAAVTEAAEAESAGAAGEGLSAAPSSPRLARELRQLLREIETAP